MRLPIFCFFRIWIQKCCVYFSSRVVGESLKDLKISLYGTFFVYFHSWDPKLTVGTYFHISVYRAKLTLENILFHFLFVFQSRSNEHSRIRSRKDTTVILIHVIRRNIIVYVLRNRRLEKIYFSAILNFVKNYLLY